MSDVILMRRFALYICINEMNAIVKFERNQPENITINMISNTYI